MTKEALKLALEYVELVQDDRYNAEHIDREALVAAIKEALMSVPDGAQPEQEPVAWMNDSTPSGIFARHMEGAKNFGCTIPLYTTPPQRTWVGLTEKDLELLSAEWRIVYGAWMDDFARDIEAKLKEKNT